MKNFEMHFAKIYSATNESSYNSVYEGVYDQFIFYDEEDEYLDEMIGDEPEEGDFEDEEDVEIVDDCFVYFPGSDEVGVS